MWLMSVLNVSENVVVQRLQLGTIPCTACCQIT